MIRLERKDLIVAKTLIINPITGDQYEVSTVKVPEQGKYCPSKMFETMIFAQSTSISNDYLDDATTFYSSWMDAEVGHEAAIEKLKGWFAAATSVLGKAHLVVKKELSK